MRYAESGRWPEEIHVAVEYRRAGVFIVSIRVFAFTLPFSLLMSRIYKSSNSREVGNERTKVVGGE